MEVHHHSHTSRKKWTHYFWEFLMLFLAVFCGFLAEYKLEHVIEHQREKQYIRSLIADLEEDNKNISNEIIKNEIRIDMMDSMIAVFNDMTKIRGAEGTLYYWGRITPRLGTLPVNTRTFEQLKNSGNFRLIRKIETSNQIMAYYESLPSIRMLEDIFFREFDQYKILAAQIFEPAVFRNMETDNDEIIRTDSNPALQTYEPRLIRQFSVFAVYLNGSGRGLLNMAKELRQKGKELTEYLEKEYHLK